MQLDVPFKYLNLKPNQEILNFDFSLITQSDWLQDKSLSESKSDLFGSVQTFLIQYFSFDKWIDPRNKYPIPQNEGHPIYNLVMEEVRKLEKFYDASAKVVCLDGLPPNSGIPTHFDKSNIYSLCHRVHLPLVTDPNVIFTIDNIPNYFKVGEYFEFDNKRLHSVKNNSNLFRIHLLVDLLPNKITL